MRWVGNSEQSAYMRERQRQNKVLSVKNSAENWAHAHLKTTGLSWQRQALWGCRIFDFWCAEKGCAVEIDGAEHDPTYDLYRDKYNYLRSGLIVLRVRNFNDAEMADTLRAIGKLGKWRARKADMGLLHRSRQSRRALLIEAGMPIAHTNWKPEGI